jgi:dynein heavy chain, axonemal
VQSFLTAALQNFARKRQIPIDMIAYHHQMLQDREADLTDAPAEGVYVYGLFLEGCGWDATQQRLCESEPRVLFAPAPCMWLRPFEMSELPDTRAYRCPLYRTAERRGTLATTGHSTNFVMFVNLPTDTEPDHWTLRGVAMLSQLSD